MRAPAGGGARRAHGAHSAAQGEGRGRGRTSRPRCVRGGGRLESPRPAAPRPAARPPPPPALGGRGAAGKKKVASDCCASFPARARLVFSPASSAPGRVSHVIQRAPRLPRHGRRARPGLGLRPAGPAPRRPGPACRRPPAAPRPPALARPLAAGAIYGQCSRESAARPPGGPRRPAPTGRPNARPRGFKHVKKFF